MQDPKRTRAGDELAGCVAVVTGAASGIGLACALEFASRGAALAVCDLDGAGLRDLQQRLESGRAVTYGAAIDVADIAAVRRFATETRARIGKADILVNCAGIGLMSSFSETDLADFSRVIDVNLGGVVNVCRTFLPELIESNRAAHIINIASLGGIIPMPYASAYSASKHAVIGFSESLRVELQPLGVGVSVICPGPVRTAFATNSMFRGGWAKYQSVLSDMLAGSVAADDWLGRLLRPITPESVARVAAESVLRSPRTVVLPASARTLATTKRLLPGMSGRVADIIARQLQRAIV